MPPALIVFVKNPIPGKTKTRLAATVGDAMALKMYGILTRWTRDQAVGLGDDVTRYVYYSDEISTGDDWPEGAFQKFVQSGDDLGARMENALRDVLSRGHGSAIIIGSDCPGVTTTYLNEAFERLNTHDLVVGPALDGGYTLLGVHRAEPALFRGVAWSTDQVLAATLTAADKNGLSVCELVPLSDVDYIQDWYSYGWTLPDTPE